MGSTYPQLAGKNFWNGALPQAVSGHKGGASLMHLGPGKWQQVGWGWEGDTQPVAGSKEG